MKIHIKITEVPSIQRQDILNLLLSTLQKNGFKTEKYIGSAGADLIAAERNN